MKEFITLLLDYEIYARITAVCIIGSSLSYTIIVFFDRLLSERRTKRREMAESRRLSDGDEIDFINLEDNSEQNLDVQNDVSTEVLTDIAQKLLQQIEIESNPENEIINKLEKRERESDISGESMLDTEKFNTNNTIPEQISQEESKEKEKQADLVIKNKESATTVEIYNIQTNLETMNRQRSRFEALKNDIESLKTRGLRVDYEKKLVEATIDFPDDEHFNTTLGDRYIDNKDFKKAQTIYKKLHFANELDDKALYKLGVINLELGDIQAAEYLITKAKEIKPENPRYYQTLAEVKYNLEKVDECIELMEKAVDLRPTKFEYIEILGKLYKETNNVQLYYKTLLKMNALEPLNQKVRSELGKLQD